MITIMFPLLKYYLDTCQCYLVYHSETFLDNDTVKYGRYPGSGVVLDCIDS